MGSSKEFYAASSVACCSSLLELQGFSTLVPLVPLLSEKVLFLFVHETFMEDPLFTLKEIVLFISSFRKFPSHLCCS